VNFHSAHIRGNFQHVKYSCISEIYASTSPAEFQLEVLVMVVKIVQFVPYSQKN